MIPTTYYPWAFETDTQYIQENGYEGTVPNKKIPESQFLVRGIYYGEGMTIQYWNYQNEGCGRWFNHLDERLGIGDLYPTTEDLTLLTIENRLGGTWELLGTTTIASQTTYWWKKIT